MMEVCEGRSMVMRCIKEGNKFRKKLLKVSSPTSEFRDMVSCVTDVKTSRTAAGRSEGRGRLLGWRQSTAS